MKLHQSRVELRLLRIVTYYGTSSVTSWVEAVTNCCQLWIFVRYELSWGCNEMSPAIKLRPLRVELRLLRIVARYEISSVTSCVEVVTIFRPLWNFVCMSWVEAVTNCRPLWNFVRYELSWGCYERSPSMKLCPLRVELRLLRIVARYETLSVTSWVEAVTNCRPLWNFVRYELSWGCYELLPAMKLRPLRVALRLLRFFARYETSSVWVELKLLRIVARYETSSLTSWVEAATNCRPLWNFVRFELSWGCHELLPAMKLRPLRVALSLLRFFARYETSSVWVELKLLGIVARYELRPLRVELRLLRKVALYEILSVTSWVEAVTNCCPLWNFVRYELSWGCYERSPSMKLCPLRVELRLLLIVACYETSSVTSCVEAVTNCRPLWNFVRYELSWGCYELLPAMKLRPLRVGLRLLRFFARYETSSVWVELKLLRIVSRYETSSLTSWVEAATNCRPLWNFVRFELSWGCHELLPAMKLRPLRVALRLLRFFARYETSSVWVELKLLGIVARYELRPLRVELRLLRKVALYETLSVTSWDEAVTNCCPLWNFVRYELSWGCYERSPSMKLCPLRVELRLLLIVACYETSSVTSCVEVVTIFRPLWNFFCMSWVEAVKNCRQLWNIISHELSWGCHELLPAMKLRPLRVALRLLRFFARYETSSVWVELKLLGIVARYELRPLRVELRLLRKVALYETLSVTSWDEAVTNCCPLWNFVRYELSWGCYERSPSMKLCPLRVELRLLLIVACYETSSVTSCVEVVTIFRPLWNFVCMSWVEAVRNCRPLWTSSVTSWVEAVTKGRPLWNFVRYELRWGCY